MENPSYNESVQATVPAQKTSKGITVLKAIGAVVLAVLLFFAAQFAVTFVYMIMDVIKTLIEVGFDLTNIDTMSPEFLDAIEMAGEKTLSNALLISLISNLFVLLVLCLTYTLRRKSVSDGLSIRSANPIRYVSFAVFGMALQVFVSIIIAFIPIPPGVLESHNAQYDVLINDNIFLEIISAGLVTGIVEELIFRAVATKQLKRFMHPTAAVIVSAVIFGLVHPTLLSMIYATLLGLILGTLYIKYDSVVPSIICHVFFNSASSLLARIPEDWSFLILVFFVISIPVLIYLTKSLFFRYPTASDLLFDSKGTIKPRNSAEAAVINELNRLKESGSISEADLHKIDKDWERAKKAKADLPAVTADSTCHAATDSTENEENKGDNKDETL